MNLGMKITRLDMQFNPTMMKQTWSTLEAPTFDGQLDPQVFLEWTIDMDHYFNWHNMSNERRIWFAKMKLISQARKYSTNVKKRMKLRNEEPIQTWDEMKMKLQEKYLPVSYKHRLLDQWQCLTQGNGPVSTSKSLINF